jgi:hypothetical protein
VHDAQRASAQRRFPDGEIHRGEAGGGAVDADEDR